MADCLLTSSRSMTAPYAAGSRPGAARVPDPVRRSATRKAAACPTCRKRPARRHQQSVYSFIASAERDCTLMPLSAMFTAVCVEPCLS